mgnify:CR=1 FL=1
MNSLSFAGLLTFFTYSIIAAITFFNRRSKLHIAWTAFNLYVGIWGIGAYLISISREYTVSTLAWQFAHVGIIFIPILLFHTIEIFCNLNHKKWLFTIYCLGLLFLAFNMGGLLFSKDLKYVFDEFYYIKRTIVYDIFLTFWIFVFLAPHWFLLKEFRKSEGFRKKQIPYFFVGTVVGFSGGLINFFPVYNIDIYPLGNFLLPIYPILTTYAIFKYRLMDVSLVITRTGIFIAVYSIVLGIPFALAFGWREQLQRVIGEMWWLAPLISSTVLATVGPFIFLYIQRKAEDRLLQEQRRYQTTLRRASLGMGRVKDLRRLLKLTVNIVTRTVRI